jgi:hypothetical protein
MRKRVSLWVCAVGTCAIVGWAGGARAQAEPQSEPNPVVVVSPVAPPMGAESTSKPNMTLLGTGIATFVFGYGPAASVPIYSDHKGDENLYIPFAGPWLDLANRDCTGPTIPTDRGPAELASGLHCGTSTIEGAALITSGVVQGLALVQVMAAFFVPQKGPTGFQVPSMPRFAIIPTIGPGGTGAMARGRF